MYKDAYINTHRNVHNYTTMHTEIHSKYIQDTSSNRNSDTVMVIGKYSSKVSSAHNKNHQLISGSYN